MLRFHVGTRRYFIQVPATAALGGHERDRPRSSTRRAAERPAEQHSGHLVMPIDQNNSNEDQSAESLISRLLGESPGFIARPARTPVNASPRPSRGRRMTRRRPGSLPFGAELFHLLLHAGLSRRFHKIEHRLFSQITMNWRGDLDQPRGPGRHHRLDPDVRRKTWASHLRPAHRRRALRSSEFVAQQCQSLPP
jgi:hypothetical protein